MGVAIPLLEDFLDPGVASGFGRGHGTPAPEYMQKEERLLHSARAYVAAVEQYGAALKVLDDPVKRVRSLRIAVVVINAWVRDASESSRKFGEALASRRSSAKKLLKDAQRIGHSVNIKATREIIDSIDRSTNLNTHAVRQLIKICDRVENQLRVAERHVPENSMRRTSLYARPSSAGFEDAVSEVMEKTSVAREYLAR
jgi:uncharacterized protein (DUF1778 family)